MGMDMLEHEGSEAAISTLATRADLALFTFGGSGTNKLQRSFLIKRMEIEFMLNPPTVTTIGGMSTAELFYLVFRKTTGGSDIDTTAEAFDADVEDDSKHKVVIWSRPGVARPLLLDDTENVVDQPPIVVWKTSKSFPKGYPLDKDEDYTWSVFNAAGSTFVTGYLAFLRVRYWGVKL